MRKLDAHFGLLRRLELIVHWSDHMIGPGDEWRGKIEERLNSAEVILLLLSPSFLNSDYCNDVEVKRAMERHDAGDVRVVPVVLRPCAWEIAPFGKLQALPKGAKAVTTWKPQDRGFKSIVDGVQDLVMQISAERRT